MFDALSQMALLIMDISYKKPEKEVKMWHEFTEIVKEGEWSYLELMAAQYRKDTEKMLVLGGVCPHCDVKLTRDDAPGKEILRCPSCNSRWTLPTKD